MRLLIDADILIYRACAAVETETRWDDDMWTLHADAAEAKFIISSQLMVLREEFPDSTMTMCLSDKENWRKEILPTYKGNRKGKRKPVCYKGVLEWLKDTYYCRQEPRLEADDLLGILGSNPDTDDCVIVTMDKDLKQIPNCPIYNLWGENKVPLPQSTKESAHRFHMLQALTGDAVDGYGGCPGVGPVGAKRLLAAVKDRDLWGCVVGAYEKKDLNHDDALVQARVANILLHDQYDFETKEVKLWGA